MVARREISGEELAALMIREFGPIRGVQLMGWVLLWALRGKPTLRHVVNFSRTMLQGRTSVYRYIEDMRRLMVVVAEREGQPAPDLSKLDEALAELAERFDLEVGAEVVPA